MACAKKCFGAFLLVASSSVCNGFLSPTPKVSLSTNPTILSLKLIPEAPSLDILLDTVSNLLADVPEEGGVSYSKASYYTVLGLYLFSFPGLWSTIQRSTKAKVKRKTYVS
jgi:hypothetical protein